MSKKITIAIDGPAGSGKSTAAKLLAEKIGYIYLDTGAMYRAITYYILENKIFDDIKSIVELVKNINIKLKFENGITRIFLNGNEVTEYIRTPAVNAKVSEISKIPEVRNELVKIQRKIGNSISIVAEGRDTTTAVFPDADIKIYLNATLEERVQRRYKEFQEKNEKISIDEVRRNIEKRDRIDRNRDMSPLRKAEDAIEIDTTELTVAEEVEKIISKLNEIEPILK